MPKQYSIADARGRLPSLVDEAEQGAEVQITRRGKPVAVLVSVDRYRRLVEGRTGLWSALEAFRRRHELDGDAASAFDDVRDRSPGRPVKW